MVKTFWQELQQQKSWLLGLSPMDGVTDYPFRAMIKKYGQPDVIFTEFANVEGICHGASEILHHFDFDAAQQPVIAQIFGKTPTDFYQVAILLAELGVSGIDINMGCPAKTVSSHGSGAGLIRTPQLAQEIVRQVRQGLHDWQNGKNPDDCPDLQPQLLSELRRRRQQLHLPEATRQQGPTVSVKTRIGYNGDEIQEWLPYLFDLQLAALSLHGRSLKQAYSGEANWQVIARAVELKNSLSPATLLLGNGDVKDYEMAQAKVQTYHVDGVLIGRASMGNPYVFLPSAEREKAVAAHSLLEIALEHATLYEQTYQWEKNYLFLPMRKHLACYTKGIKDATKLRLQLIKTQSAAEVRQILSEQHLLSQPN